MGNALLIYHVDERNVPQCSMRNFLQADPVDDRFVVSVFDVRNEQINIPHGVKLIITTHTEPSLVKHRKSAQPRGHGIPCL